jgi:streptogramin lyase
MSKLLSFFILISVPFVLLSQTNSQYSWRYYRPGNTGIQGDYATSLWIDESGNPYIAANTGNWGEGGFARFNLSDSSWTNYSNVDYEVLGSFDNADIQILDIVEDFNQNLWMGTFRGALKFNHQEGISTTVNYGPENSELLGFTYDIDVAPDSTVWFISDHLVRYNPKNNQWTSWDEGSNIRIAIQPKTDGSYLVWSADTYFGYVFTFNSATNGLTFYTPEAIGDIAGLPGKDCVDDAGNLWVLRMSFDGNWETLEYQRPDGSWVYPTPPYENISYYIDAFKAFGDGKALLVTANGEAWYFDGTAWQNYGIWRPYEVTTDIDIDQDGNVWVCGVAGAARRDAITGEWQRYRITNTSQIDYFVEDLTIDAEGSVWFTGNAGSGVGGFQKFDGSKWTGFNEYNYGLGHPFPFEADNTQAIYSRPSNNDVVINPTYHGIHAWTGTDYSPIEDIMTTSKGFTEDSNGRLWSLGEYYNIRYYEENTNEWITLPIVGWGSHIQPDPATAGNIWATTDYEIQRTDGITSFSRAIEDFPGSAACFTGFAADENGIVWVGTWSQFTSTGSTLIRFDANTGLYQTWSYDEGWPFPGEHVRPLTITSDGRIWMQYDSEYPSTNAGLLWYDGDNIEIFPSSPGGVPQWGGLPNSTINDLEVKELPNGYELWMSCLGRGIAVLEVNNEQVGISDSKPTEVKNNLSVFPNPASENVSIVFNHDRDGFVEIAVYDILGKRIKEILHQSHVAGQQSTGWDLTDQSGNKVESGIYVVRYSDSERIQSAKIVVR